MNSYLKFTEEWTLYNKNTWIGLNGSTTTKTEPQKNVYSHFTLSAGKEPGL